VQALTNVSWYCYLLIYVLPTISLLCEQGLSVIDLFQHSTLVGCNTMEFILQWFLWESSVIHLFYTGLSFVTGISHHLSYCWWLQTGLLMCNCVYDFIMKDQQVVWGSSLLCFGSFQYFLCPGFWSKQKSLFCIYFVKSLIQHFSVSVYQNVFIFLRTMVQFSLRYYRVFSVPPSKYWDRTLHRPQPITSTYFPVNDSLSSCHSYAVEKAQLNNPRNHNWWVLPSISFLVHHTETLRVVS
jgi:hypothetical protein